MLHERIQIFDIYQYNSKLKLKEIQHYNISYIPRKKWYSFSILVNGVYCGQDLNILEFGKISTKKLITDSIKNYCDVNIKKHQHRKKISFPNDNSIHMYNVIFEKIFNMTKIDSRDYLSEHGLEKLEINFDKLSLLNKDESYRFWYLKYKNDFIMKNKLKYFIKRIF